MSAATLATLIMAAGCSGVTSTSTPPNNGPLGAPLYMLVPNQGLPGTSASEVIAFPSNTSGTASPESVLILPANLSTIAMTSDSAGNIYVAGNTSLVGDSEVLVYTFGSSGNAAPARTIDTGQPASDLIGSLAVDSSGQIYVPIGVLGEVEVFAAGANGAATPVRTIRWDPTVFAGGDTLAVDASGSLYITGYLHGTAAGLTNPTEIVVYAPGASGLATPVRKLVGSNVEVSLDASSIAVDSSGNLFAIVAIPSAPWLNATEIAEFAPGTSSNATPLKTIIGNYGTFGVGPTHLQIDGADNVYVIAQYQNFNLPQSPIPVGPSVAVFSSLASGTVSPGTQFSGAALNDGAFGFAYF